MQTPNLPAKLQPYQDAIEASIRPFVRVRTNQQTHEKAMSHFGGLPCIPEDFTYPKDATGKPMQLLAQIDFSEVPRLEGFPEQGLLQCYVADDNLYGLNLNEPAVQKGFAVVYFETAAETARTDFSFLPAFAHQPVRTVLSLRFEAAEAPVSTEDIHFDEVFGEPAYELFEALDDEMAAKKAYQQLAQVSGHKIGGYAHFTQEDPRWTHEAYAEAVLLLQIDSEGEAIQWGDSGIASFFILPEDLKQKDFSRVLYYWDSP